MKNNLGELILRARNEKGISQGKLAEALGYENGQYISNCERGMSGLPPDKFRDIAKILGLKTDDLIDAAIADEKQRLKEIVRKK